METIGVGELRRNASRYLRRVTAGEPITITVRGKPVAVLAPVQRSEGSLIEKMIAGGQLVPGTGAALPEPLEAVSDLTASEVLQWLREDRL